MNTRTTAGRLDVNLLSRVTEVERDELARVAAANSRSLSQEARHAVRFYLSTIERLRSATHDTELVLE